MEKTLAASVMVHIKDLGTGSGTVIFWDSVRDKSIISTNNHVCQMTRGKNQKGALNKFKLEIIDTNGKKYNGLVVATNQKGDDLCLIEVDKKIATPIILAGESTKVGTKIHSIGAPQGWFPLIYEGYAGPIYMIEGILFQVFPIGGTYGSSGSGVYDSETGEMVAVVFAMQTHDDKLKIPFFIMAVPVGNLKILMQRYSNANKLNWKI